MMTSHGEKSHDERDMSSVLLDLASQIVTDLNSLADQETLHLCGLTPSCIISSDPDLVLQLAYSLLYAAPYHEMPVQWRRLYEEASLWKACRLLEEQAELMKSSIPDGNAKRRKIDQNGASVPAFNAAEWMQEVVRILDLGIFLSGAPGRAAVFQRFFEELNDFVDDNEANDMPLTFAASKPNIPELHNAIFLLEDTPNFEDFQMWVTHQRKPVLINGALENWKARVDWQNPRYLLKQTLGGRRVVPIEIGETYTKDDWTQRPMTMREFMTSHLLPDGPTQTGYLAQHDLFAQIPALRNDVVIPDYCYADPPAVSGDALKTAGLAATRTLDEPMMNAWLGPKGTRTPLHTDAYHNILCQVVGYKYVRLYSPSEADKLYRCGVDDKGINLENTSQVDVSLFRDSDMTKAEALQEARHKFPAFETARYEEAVLGPGQCLYVPLGWWHYVESLTTSFSVSFWWN
jgi:hypothetical protein